MSSIELLEVAARTPLPPPTPGESHCGDPHSRPDSPDPGLHSAVPAAVTNSPAPPKTPSSADWVDVGPAPTQDPTTPDSPELQVTEHELLDVATGISAPIPEDAEFPPLPKPILVPRLNPGEAIPFARAWAPELAKHAVAKEDFVGFIDNLNIIMTPHAAFHVMEFTGAAVGLVPYDVAEGIGGALEGIAVLGTVAMNYKRMKDYLARMNADYFHPRRLHMKIIGTKRLRKLFGLDKKDPCLAPVSEETIELSAQERCLRYLADYISELSFDVPAPSPATTTLAKIRAWEIRHKIRKADRAAKAGRKRALKRHQKGKKPMDRWNSRVERERVNALDWILVQNIKEWEVRKAEKEAEKEEKRKTSVWRHIL